MPEYDAIVIGTGPGGESVIGDLNDAGCTVAAIERELIGGTCAYWGCIPSKTLLRPGAIVWDAQHGFGTGEPSVAWPAVSAYRNYICRNWDDSAQADQYRDKGIDVYRGSGTLVGPGEVQVEGQTLRARHIVIATGSAPNVPPIEGLKETGYWTNKEATSFQEVPESVLVVGGGAVGAELAQVFRSYGAAVSIVENSDHLLGRTPAEAAAYVADSFTAQGIELHLGRKAVKFERVPEGKRLTLDNGETIVAREVLIAVGRHPNLDGLGLDTIGIQTSRTGIGVDATLAAAENVWAVGDVTGVSGFTHVADYQGHVAAANILGRRREASYTEIPAVTFTDPEVATVGISDPSMAPQGMQIVTAKSELTDASRTYTYGENIHGALCLLADRDAKTLVGAWAAGPVAGEWVQLATTAIRAKIPVDVLDDTILAFPTFTRLFLQPLHKLQQQLSQNNQAPNP